MAVSDVFAMIDAVVSLLLCAAASDPVCALNASSQDDIVVDGDRLQLACSVNYSGNWAPTIHCLPTGNGGRSTATRSTVTYTERLLVTPSLNRATVSCTTDFEESHRRRINIGHLTFADNTPTYLHTWTSQPLNVLCTSNTRFTQIYFNLILLSKPAYSIFNMVAPIALGTIIVCTFCISVFIFTARSQRLSTGIPVIFSRDVALVPVHAYSHKALLKERKNEEGI